MKVTVKEILQMEILKNAKVLAGESEIDKRIRNVSVLEGVNGNETASCVGSVSELVVSGFFHVKDNVDEQVNIVKALCDNKCSALIIMHVGEVVKEISPEVIAAAENGGLVLISVPEGTRTSSDIAREITSELLYGDNFGNRLISNTVFHLLNFEKHRNFQEAIKEAALNNDFQLILLSEDFNPVLGIETRDGVSLEEIVSMGRSRELNTSPVYTLVDVNGVLTYWGPVMINGEKHFMLIVDNEDSYSAAEITKLAEIIELAIGMWKYTPDRDPKTEFIKALRRGNTSVAYSLREDAGAKGDEILCVFYARGIETPEGRQIIADFEKTSDLRIMKVSEGDDTYGIIFSVGSGNLDDMNNNRNMCNELFSRLKAEDKEGTSENPIRIFHVLGVDGIEGAADAYRLISETWLFVQNVFPYKRVFTKYEMVLVSSCISIQQSGGFVKKNYMDLLEPFREAGETKGRQLLETLETFVLDAGMNSAKTSEFMGIHTNTVQYRLKKINDILSAEITGNRVIPGLTIALALKRLERVVK